jgi:hypothetical protein
VIRSSWGTGAADFAHAQHLIFDSGPLGEGNHGHFDALSFELAAFGRSLIVDPGRYTYSEAVDPADGINWRVHFRGTAAHNTVCIDGKQQTRYEPKAPYAPGTARHKISGPPAKAKRVERFHAPHLDLLHGRVRSHEYDAVHERCIAFVDRQYWIVSDWLCAQSEHDYVLNFQLGAHAQDACTLDTTRGLRLHSPGLLIVQPARDGVQQVLAQSWVSQRYGDKQRAPALRTTLRARDARFDTVLMPWQAREPFLNVENYCLKSNRYNSIATVLRMDLAHDGERVSDHWLHTRGAGEFHGAVADFTFSGRWLYWRTAADGRVLRVATHGGATVTGAAVPLMTADLA